MILRREKVAAQWKGWRGHRKKRIQITEQFCTISLLSAEGKIFFKIVAQCLTEFLLKNAYRYLSSEGESPRGAWSIHE